MTIAGLTKALHQLCESLPDRRRDRRAAAGGFVGRRDEAAFAALVRRHGPMVLGVCRRVLRNAHDAEDAFQATFLVLARKAASVVQRERSAAGCTASPTAPRTGSGSRTGRRAPREAGEGPCRTPNRPGRGADWRPLLDRELSRLPEKYRAAVVLCDLEGRPRQEAARRLGVPEGTLSGRLAAARQMLAKRLAGCGLALSGGALAAAMSQGTASAPVPSTLTASTAKAAALAAAGSWRRSRATPLFWRQECSRSCFWKS